MPIEVWSIILNGHHIGEIKILRPIQKISYRLTSDATKQ